MKKKKHIEITFRRDFFPASLAGLVASTAVRVASTAALLASLATSLASLAIFSNNEPWLFCAGRDAPPKLPVRLKTLLMLMVRVGVGVGVPDPVPLPLSIEASGVRTVLLDLKREVVEPLPML